MLSGSETVKLADGACAKLSHAKQVAKNNVKAFIRLIKLYNHTKVRKKVSILANLNDPTAETALLLERNHAL